MNLFENKYFVKTKIQNILLKELNVLFPNVSFLNIEDRYNNFWDGSIARFSIKI